MPFSPNEDYQVIQPKHHRLRTLWFLKSISRLRWGEKKNLYNANKCVFFLALNTTLPFYLFQGGSIQNRKSRRCLELVASGDNEFGYQLALQKCTGQKWFITNMLFSSTSWLTGAPATQKEQHTLKWICVCVCVYTVRACACVRAEEDSAWSSMFNAALSSGEQWTARRKFLQAFYFG